MLSRRRVDERTSLTGAPDKYRSDSKSDGNRASSGFEFDFLCNRCITEQIDNDFISYRSWARRDSLGWRHSIDDGKTTGQRAKPEWQDGFVAFREKWRYRSSAGLGIHFSQSCGCGEVATVSVQLQRNIASRH
jgi:hypothetical protein